MSKRHRIPPTTGPWPESRGISRRHRRLHLMAVDSSPNKVEVPEAGSTVQRYRMGDLSRFVRGLRRKV